MKLSRVLTVLLIAAVGLTLGFFVFNAGCASTLKQVHFEKDVDATTLLMTGPARGHWSEESEHLLIVYTVLGNDCRSLPSKDIGTSLKSSGTFFLGPGASLCAAPLRSRQHVLIHGETL